jgi:hypothetical protein
MQILVPSYFGRSGLAKCSEGFALILGDQIRGPPGKGPAGKRERGLGPMVSVRNNIDFSPL